MLTKHGMISTFILELAYILFTVFIINDNVYQQNVTVLLRMKELRKIKTNMRSILPEIPGNAY
jgi:hypothetical protein